jgi:hypothetical protein
VLGGLQHHSIHIVFAKLFVSMAACTSHSGFDGPGGVNHYHFVHHQKYECNYGDILIPWDFWLGTYESGEDLKERYRGTRGVEEPEKKATVAEPEKAENGVAVVPEMRDPSGFEDAQEALDLNPENLSLLGKIFGTKPKIPKRTRDASKETEHSKPETTVTGGNSVRSGNTADQYVTLSSGGSVSRASSTSLLSSSPSTVRSDQSGSTGHDCEKVSEPGSEDARSLTAEIEREAAAGSPPGSPTSSLLQKGKAMFDSSLSFASGSRSVSRLFGASTTVGSSSSASSSSSSTAALGKGKEA